MQGTIYGASTAPYFAEKAPQCKTPKAHKESWRLVNNGHVPRLGAPLAGVRRSR